MAMKRCPVCGEKYSDTYKDCPFCEEEAALREGGPIRRSGGRGGKRAAQRRPSLLSPVLILLILLMLALLAYLLFGNQIADKLGLGESAAPPVTDQTEPKPPVVDGVPGTEDGTEDPDAPTVPDTPDEPDGTGLDYAAASQLPAGLTLSNTDFSLFQVGETHTITVSGGSGSYQWFSQDEGVASVDETGKVTAVSKGDISIVVTDGEKQGTCIVRVKVPAAGTTTAPAVSDNGSGGSHTLNREDMTLSVGEKFQLKLSGVTTALTWSTTDAGVASVAGDGTVTGVAPGKTTITVSWDGASRSCTVYVKR